MLRSSLRLLAVLLLSIGQYACGERSPRPPDGTIVFAARQDGRFVVVKKPARGGDATVVLADPVADVFPAPGAPILGIASVPEQREELVLEDGKRIGGASRMTRSPSRPKDGSFIVFESDRASFRDLYRAEVNSGEVRRLTDDREGNFEPSVSPDGLLVVFASSKAGNPDINVMNADGTNRRALTTEPAEDVSPVWSPDGAVIAFISTREGQDRIFLMKPDGTEVRRATDGDGMESLPTWSPDGKHLAYVVQRPTGSSEIRVIAAGGGASRSLSTGTKPHDDQPSWSPDGRWLAYASRTGEDEGDVWIVDAAGKTRRRFTTDAGLEMLPRWLSLP